MRYVALLRAVNVGGRTVKMDRLRALFTELELRDVETFIASGNVIFESRARAPALEKRIEAHLEKSLGFAVPTLLRSAGEIAAAVAHEAFPGSAPLNAAGRLYVGFLKTETTPAGRAKVEAMSDDSNRFAVCGRELYWRADDRRAVVDIPITTFERALGTDVTFRNVATVRKIAERYCVDSSAGR